MSRKNLLLTPSLMALLSCFATATVAPSSAAATYVTPANALAPMLAPIALYPDSLLAQVLTASQFPDQVTAASRWLKANPKLQGTAAARAAARQRWNGSVQSLINFPTVLHSMSSQPAWMRELGQAYARAPGDVMAGVQQLRKQARKAGSLTNSTQQTIVVTGDYISIDPVNPHVVYVPSYDPIYVYGAWAYAAPPVVVVPRETIGSAVAKGIGFGVGVAVSNALWGDIDWGHNRTVVNHYYTDNSIYIDNSSSSSHSYSSINAPGYVPPSDVSYSSIDAPGYVPPSEVSHSSIDAPGYVPPSEVSHSSIDASGYVPPSDDSHSSIDAPGYVPPSDDSDSSVDAPGYVPPSNDNDDDNSYSIDYESSQDDDTSYVTDNDSSNDDGGGYSDDE